MIRDWCQASRLEKTLTALAPNEYREAGDVHQAMCDVRVNHEDQKGCQR